MLDADMIDKMVKSIIRVERIGQINRRILAAEKLYPNDVPFLSKIYALSKAEIEAEIEESKA